MDEAKRLAEIRRYTDDNLKTVFPGRQPIDMDYLLCVVDRLTRERDEARESAAFLKRCLNEVRECWQDRFPDRIWEDHPAEQQINMMICQAYAMAKSAEKARDDARAEAERLNLAVQVERSERKAIFKLLSEDKATLTTEIAALRARVAALEDVLREVIRGNTCLCEAMERTERCAVCKARLLLAPPAQGKPGEGR